MSFQSAERVLRDKMATDHVDWYVQNRGVWHDWSQKCTLERELRLSGTEVCFDAGCGVGRISLHLAQRVQRIVAGDYSAKSVEILKSRADSLGLKNIEARVVDLTQALPFSADTFDRVWSVETLQHTHSLTPTANVLKEFSRVLRPGGICGTLNYLWRGKGQKEAVYGEGLYRCRFAPEEIRQWFQDAGFVGIRVFPVIVVPRRLLKSQLAARVGLTLERWLSPRRFGEFVWCAGTKAQ